MQLNDIFLTGKTNWKNEGGLLGLVLTIADATGASSSQYALEYENKTKELQQKISTLDKSNYKHAKQIKHLEAQMERVAKKFGENAGKLSRKSTLSLYGAPNLTHLLATARRFIFRKGLPFYVTEYGNDFDPKTPENNEEVIPPSFKDENIKVWAMPIAPSPNGTGDGEKTSRKRTRQEFEENANAPEPASESTTTPSALSQEAIEKQQRDQIVRQAIVSEMFNSDWKMDALVEVPLREAPAQATLFVRNAETHKIEKYERPKEGEEIPDITVLTRKPWPGANIETLPPTSPSEVSVSYIVQHHDVRGKFDPEKAMALNVEKGAKFGLLTQGQSVVAQDGKTITPEMVMGETQIGRAFMVAELPTTAYIDGLISRPEFTRNPELMKALTSIVWILGPGVGNDPKLRQFMEGLKDVKHVISSPDYSPNTITFKSSATALTRFSKVDGDRYQPPLYSNTRVPQASLSELSSTLNEADNVEIAAPGLSLQMQPTFLVDRSEVSPPFNVNEVETNGKPAGIQKRIESPQFKQRLEAIRKNDLGHDVEIFALGTGSSLPSKYRNVSATLVKVPGVGNYLLDCGEGTLGQLKRMFPDEELKQILRDLKMIWISHLHADHHLGTASLIRAWNEVVHGTDRPIDSPRHDVSTLLQDACDEKRLFVVSGLRMIDWLREYANVEYYGFDKIVPLCSVSFLENGKNTTLLKYFHLNPDMSQITLPSGDAKVTMLSFDDDTTRINTKALTPSLRQATGLQYLDTTLVPHCHDARAVALTFPSGFKVSYSGDCRPSERFVAIGKDSTVLIHEATFEDDMIGDAIAKRHTTVSEALGVAQRMRARNLILTHFSQRYQSVPDLSGSHSTAGSSTPGSSRSRSQSASRDTSSSAPLRATYDVPIDLEDEESTAGVDLPPTLNENDDYDPRLVPVVVAFDMMRLRLGDAAYAEAHLHALMRTYVATEGEDDAEADEAKKTPQQENKKAKDKNKNKGKNKNKNKEQKK